MKFLGSRREFVKENEGWMNGISPSGPKVWHK